MRGITSALALALGLLLIGAGPGAAQKVQCPSGGLQQAEQARPQAGGMVQGSVTSVAPELQLFSLREPSGEFTAFHITPGTQIRFPDGNVAALADLEEGQQVRASYRVNEAGQYIADQVDIVSERAPGAERVPRQQGMGGAPAGGWKSDQAQQGGAY